MTPRLLLPLTLFATLFLPTLHAASFLVENGQPRAEVIISDKPTRMQRVAAHEFRAQIEKISGARLPIFVRPTGNAVKVFIGASAAALEFTSEPRTRDAILLLQGQNRENNLKNDGMAFDAYAAIVADREQIGAADEFAALQGIARVLTRKGRFDEALAALHRANPDKLKGVWKINILKSIETVKAARQR